jgi:GTP-binding protein
MTIKKCFFLTTAPQPRFFPPALHPEVAFWGRSNVGKSSLLNVIMDCKSLARVSKTPGCTQNLNFYHCPSGIRLVDLPGYGYAKVPHNMQKRWSYLVPEYLTTRAPLWKIYLLIDSRHPLQPADLEALRFLSTLKRRYEVIFTKIDAISASLLAQRTQEFSQEFPKVPWVCASAREKRGLEHVMQFIGIPSTAPKTPIPTAQQTPISTAQQTHASP